MKKLLAFLLAMTLVFTSVAFAFADEEISGAAQTCLKLGMLKGDGNGVTPEYLASTPNRLQTAVMFLRLKGLEETALAYTSDKNFADAAQVAWEGGRNIMAYLYNNPDLGWVGDGGNFNPTGIMTAQAYYKVMLETLGYKQNTATVMGDFLWADVLDFAAEHGLKEVANVENFTVNDLAAATVEALQATVKGAETTLVETLVADGIVEEDTAIEVGLVQSPLQKAIAFAQEAIAAIPAVDALTLDDEATVTAAADAIDAVIALDAEAVVEGADVVDAALAKITELQTAAADLETAITTAVEAIKLIPATVTLADKATVDAAKTALDAALALDAEAVIEGADLVQPAVDAVAAIEAAKTAADTALALVPATAKLTDKATVEAARTAVGAALELDATLTFDLAALEAAEAAIKLIETPLAVQSITATDLTTLTVTFNKAVDEDTVVPANFKIGTGANATTVSISDDKTVVTVAINTLDIATTQPANYKLTIDKVKDENGVAITKTEQTVKVFDNTLPTVTGIALTGPNTFKITFSEPMKTFGTVKINNGIYAVTVPAITTTSTTITLSASALPEGNYTVDISGYKDYAGFAIDATTLTLAYAKNTTLPVATIKSATQTEVVVEFDRAVTLDATFGGGADKYEDYFYQTFSTWRPDSVVKSGDSKTYTLTFTTYPLPEGTSTLVVKYRGAVGAGSEITDAWGNAWEVNASFPVAVTADKTAPTITNIKVVDEQTVEVYFSEDMDQTKAEDETLFTVKDADGKVVSSPTFTNAYAEDAANGIYKVTMTFGSKLNGGNYTVELKSQEDEALTPNALPTISMAFTVTDLTPITVASTVVEFVAGAAAADGEVIYVTYPEKMSTTGQYSVLNAANYLIDLDGAGAGAPVALPTTATLSMFGTTGKVVKIWIPDTALVDATTQLVIGRVADLAGNYTTELSFVETVAELTTASVAVTEVKQTDYNKITIIINKPLAVVLASGFDTGAANALAAIDSWSINSSNETVINATVAAADAADPADTSAILADLDVVADILVTESGIKMDADDILALVADYRAPKLIATNAIVDGAVANDGIAYVKFTEVLDNTHEDLYAQDLIIKDADGNVLIAGLDYQTALNAGDASILEIQGLTDEEKYTISSKSSITYICDDSAQNNTAAAFTTPVTITLH